MNYEKLLSSEQVINEVNLLFNDYSHNIKLIDIINTKVFHEHSDPLRPLIYEFAFIFKYLKASYEINKFYYEALIPIRLETNLEHTFIQETGHKMLKDLFGQNCENEYSLFSTRLKKEEIDTNKFIIKSKLRELTK